jgi:hypothetical protein
MKRGGEGGVCSEKDAAFFYSRGVGTEMSLSTRCGGHQREDL